MKKKVLSLLLAACLVVGMLPLAASAASGDPVADVYTARLHDGLEYLADDELYDSYKVEATEGENGIVDVKISAEGLQAHAMGQEPRLMGYWCGFSVKAPEGAEQAKVINGTDLTEVQTYDMGTVEASGLQVDITADTAPETINGIARWINVTDASKDITRYYKVQWCDVDGAALADSQDTIYAVNISGVKTAAQNTVETATLDDQNTPELDADLADTYEISSNELVSSEDYGLYTEVAVNVQGLKEHKNAQNNTGYWAGIAVLPPKDLVDSVKGVKCAFAKTFDEMTAAKLAEDTYGPVNASEKNGLAAYANLGEQTPKTWLKVQWTDESNKALSTTVYHIDFTGYTLAQPEENPAPELNLTVANANLEDHSAGGALVAQNQIATGFKTETGAPVWDATKNVWYFPITVTADTLKVHTNAQGNVGYWIGPAITAPEGAAKMKVKTGYSMAELDFAADAAAENLEEIAPDTKGIALYTDVTSAGSKERWLHVQWTDDSGKVLEKNGDYIFKITHTVATTQTVGVQSVEVYDEAGTTRSETVNATVENNTITLGGIAPTVETTYTLKYTTTAGGAGTVQVKYTPAQAEGTATIIVVNGTGATFSVLGTEYTVVAGFAELPANVDVVEPAPTDVSTENISDEHKTLVEDSIKTTDVKDMQIAAAELAESESFDAQQATEAGAAQLVEAGLLDAESEDPVYIYVQPYLNVSADSYTEDESGEKSMAVNITPMYRTVASTESDPSNLEVSGETEKTANAVVVAGYTGELTTLKNVEVSITLPTGFTTAESLYVQHYQHYHFATVDAVTSGEPEATTTYTATFTTEGFSPFVFSTSAAPEASVNGTYYGTFQEAVDAVTNGGEIVLNTDAIVSAKVEVEKTFKVNYGEYDVKNISFTTLAGLEVKTTDDTANKVLTVTVQTVSGGDTTTGGGGSATTYTVTVGTATNGTVTANPTSAAKGDKVTLTVAPAEGYELGTLTVKDASGNTVSTTKVSDTEYTFVMPEGNVTVSATFVEKNATPFTDVKTGDWFYNAVKYVYENKLMAGTSTTTFEPNAKLNRAQAVQILYNLEGQPTVTGTADFTDVSGHWALNAITWAAENDVVAGVGNNEFDPNANVTREQFAQMMYNYAKFKGYDLSAAGDLSSFSDSAKVSDWAEAALAWANGEGLINGNEDGTLAPNGTAIRGQAASILMNFDQNVAK